MFLGKARWSTPTTAAGVRSGSVSEGKLQGNPQPALVSSGYHKAYYFQWPFKDGDCLCRNGVAIVRLIIFQLRRLPGQSMGVSVLQPKEPLPCPLRRHRWRQSPTGVISSVHYNRIHSQGMMKFSSHLYLSITGLLVQKETWQFRRLRPSVF